MIVYPPTFEANRTIWHVQRELGDEDVPQQALWVDGFIRDVPEANEVVWLAIVLSPLAGKRVVVPGHPAPSLCEKLEALLGRAIIPSDVSNRSIVNRISSTPPGHDCILFRDAGDAWCAGYIDDQGSLLIDISFDPGRLGRLSTSSQVATNAGLVRRLSNPIDRIGELTTLLMLGPIFSGRSVKAFFCREEIGGIHLAGLIELASELKIELRLPYAERGVEDLGRIFLDLNVPPRVCFQILWERYRMHPDLMRVAFRSIEPLLDSEHLESAPGRVCQYLAHSSRERHEKNP